MATPINFSNFINFSNLFYELLCKSDAGKKGIDWCIYRIEWFVDRYVNRFSWLSLDLVLVLVCLVSLSTPIESR
jgi:hypothetical protein